MAKINVLIVEDDPLIAEDIRDLLSRVNYNIVGIAHSKADALNLLRNTSPDISLLDINLGDNTDGILIAEIINETYKIPFLYLTSYSSKVILDKVKHTLPMGYVVKPFDEADLFTAIEIAISNYSLFNKSENFTIETINASIPNKLTQKEFEVLLDMYNGCSNTEMADKNFVSVNTIKTHVQKIYEKLDAHSRATFIVKIRQLLQT
ncbi:MAG TPA: hypothetical protein DCS66_10695 [Flavobacteriaceae bacterium]|nr:hypothetical protein [Flavobacteriaceae bacterium]HAT65054.1 hypothetical protein [Flavobacteriaceae bacterium]|tara:strand:- start:985 stop:1602 length:618 start_codon:yes stop_codon:yes gene_type:complete